MPALARSRGTDFLNPRLDAVSIGTKVKVTELNTSHSETLTILGAWDFNVEQGIISYLSPIGQALLGHAVGDIVEFELEGVKKSFKIDAIEAYKNA